MPAEVFQRRFIKLILLAWMVPAVLGLGYILYIQLLSMELMRLVMTRPLEPAFILLANLFAYGYFRWFSQPLAAWLRHPGEADAVLVQTRLHAFPTHFWTHFLLYLLLAPSSVILSAELYSDYVAQPVDWFRIHLVALVVAIIVGLPIFFRILDLFGQAFGGLRLSRPQVTLKAKVFLIGALTPLLIDTMLVQYYWTRTGFFSSETFVVWLGLEIIAVLGAWMFTRSIAQSLHPLDRMLDNLDQHRTSLAAVQPASTDELGVLAARFRDLLSEREANAAVARLSNQPLQSGGEADGLAARQRQQELIELLTASASEGIYAVDTEGRCTFVNPAALRMLGFDREDQFLGQNVHALIHHTYPDGRPYAKEHCHVRHSTKEGKTTHVDDEVHWRADGSSFPVEYWSHPMYRNGELVGAVVTFVDISERRQAEAALLLNEERYRLISSVTSDVLYSCSRGESGFFAIDWAVGTVEKVFGLSTEELIARRCWRCLVHPDDLPLFDRQITELQPGQSSDFDVRILHPDGQVRHVRAYSRVLEDAQGGHRHHLYGACQDITAQKQAEATIRDSEERFRTLIENIPGAVYRCEVEAPWRVTVMSEEVEPLTGYQPSEFLHEHGVHWADLVLAEDLEGLNEAVMKGVRDKSVYRATYRIRHKRGEIRHVFEQGRAVYDPDGRPRWLDGVILDITERRHAEEALRESEERFRGMSEQSADWIWILNTTGQHTYSNRRVTDLLGYGLADFLAMDVTTLVHPEDLEKFLQTYQEAVARQQGWQNVVLRWRHKDGRYVSLESSAMALLDDEGRLTGFQGIDRDITERRRAEQALQESERRYRALFDASGECIFIMHENRFVDCNAATLRIFGCSRDEMLDETPMRFSPEFQPDGHPSRDKAMAKIEAAYRGESQVFEWRHIRYDGIPFDAEVSLTRVDLEGEPHLLATVRDVSERKQAEERIQFMAHHDALTGLPNRILLRDRFQQAKTFAERAGSHVALLFLDLDNFKVVNDTLGHAAGDHLLMAVVNRLADCIRETDTVSRQGGDEFILLVNDLQDMETVERISAKVLSRLAEPVSIDGQILHTSASIGIALYPQDGDDFDTLLLKADTAMYNAKEAGRNAYRFFDEQMNIQAREHLLLQNRLRQALENHEFRLHFQPQLDVASGRIFGVEALLRWTSPDLGEVSPGRFIPVAEDSGLVVPIGIWVLEEACRQAADWLAAGLPELSISVNLSAVQFRRPNLVEIVAAALQKSGFPARLLELELTESILLQDVERTLETVQHLKALGVRLAIDDFGTGYSSLSYLKRFAVDKLKIDQSFVRDIGSDPDDAAIVRAIIQLAKSLRLDIIAEGVETEVQMDFLRQEGCPEVQGYLIGRPMPAEALEDLLRR